MSGEGVLLYDLANWMTFSHLDHVPQPRSWEQMEGLMDGTEYPGKFGKHLEALAARTGYRISDRYVFPAVPLPMSGRIVDASQDRSIVLMRNVPLATQGGPLKRQRLTRPEVYRQTSEANETRYVDSIVDESHFQGLLAKQRVSLPLPAGVPLMKARMASH